MSLDLPATPLALAAHTVIDTELTPALRNHSVRSFLFARAAAADHGMRAGTDYDEEIVYLICALHDIGLAEVANGDQRFEVDGADYAAEFLESQGVTDERVDIIWDAIAAHTTGLSGSPVYRRRRPAAIWVAVDGIAIDIGGSADMVPAGYADRVHADYPRLGGIRALTRLVEKQAVANPAKAQPGSLPGEIVRLAHPELVPNWQDIIAAGGWGD
ncbi:HD domain-containing protein [Nocardia speluncae]|uniref:HD domain-containing protein n=1 Tax=Nocardia speluncae TaxID=419477 RepID=A0A846X8L6_9NOCA|nr:HD domain-containing protein [Nocardia speluncae]NKY32318.1 HD domain-containing protein [Nocardia speluncae]